MSDEHALVVPPGFNARLVDHLVAMVADWPDGERAEFLEVLRSGEPRRTIFTEPDGTQKVAVWIERPDGSIEPIARVRLAALDCIASADGIVAL